MEFIKRNSDYAFRGLAYMARFPEKKFFLLSQVARKTHVSEDFLRKLFQKLTQKGILISQRGRSGGFYLAKDISQITTREIIEIVQGKIVLNQCDTKEGPCISKRNCNLRKGMQSMQKRLINLFDKTTLKDLVST